MVLPVNFATKLIRLSMNLQASQQLMPSLTGQTLTVLSQLVSGEISTSDQTRSILTHQALLLTHPGLFLEQSAVESTSTTMRHRTHKIFTLLFRTAQVR